MVRGKFPFSNSTTYGKTYDLRTGKAASLEKTPDSLKFGQWMGDTSYGRMYKAPNPEDYVKKVKNVEKLSPEARYNKQYETIYHSLY